MIIYKSRLRSGTTAIRLFLTMLAVVLFVGGCLLALLMLFSTPIQWSAVLFSLGTGVLGFFLFKISAWNIRQYVIHDDHLEVRILWGIKKINHPAQTLRGYNYLKVVALNRNGGLGIGRNTGKEIRILEMEVRDFSEFEMNLKKLTPLDTNLHFATFGGYVN